MSARIRLRRLLRLLASLQLTVIGPDGALHAGMRMASAAQDGRMSLIMPRALDRQGRIYYGGNQGMGEGKFWARVLHPTASSV